MRQNTETSLVRARDKTFEVWLVTMIPGVPNGLLLVGATIIAAVVAIIVLTKRYEHKRDAAFQRAAHHLGWLSDATSTPPKCVAGLPLFNRGRRRWVSNLFKVGQSRVGATLFDYRFTTGSGKHSHTHRQTVVSFELPGVELPQFELRPENLFYKIASALGYQDIDIDHRPEFSSAYLLRGTDERATRRLFETSIARHFERHPGWCVEGAGNGIVVYRAGKRVKPGDLRQFVEDCDAIALAISGD